MCIRDRPAGGAARERDRSASPPPPAGHASSYKQFKFRSGAKQYAEASLGANGYPGIVKAADWPGWRLRRQAVAPDQLPPAEELDRTAAPEGAWEGVADAELDRARTPPPAEPIPNDGSFLATMKQALAAPPSPALPAPAPPVLQPIAPPPSMTPTNGGVLQPIVLAPSSPAPPPPAQPSSPASWPTLSDFDKSRVEALSHSCPAAAGRLAEALSRRAAPMAPASPLAPAAQPAPPGTPDAKFQEAVAML